MEDDDFEMHRTYINDQIEAASVEANAIFKEAASLIKNDKSTKFNKYDANLYMNTPILKKLQWMVNKDLFAKLETCPHIDLFNPTVWSVFLGQSDFLGCEDCVESLEQASIVYNPDRCDSCGNINIKVFHEYFANVGCILIHGSICTSCLDAQKIVGFDDQI